MTSARCFTPRRLAETSRGREKSRHGATAWDRLLHLIAQQTCSHQRAEAQPAESSARVKLNRIYNIIYITSQPSVYQAFECLQIEVDAALKWMLILNWVSHQPILWPVRCRPVDFWTVEQHNSGAYDNDLQLILFFKMDCMMLIIWYTLLACHHDFPCRLGKWKILTAQNLLSLFSPRSATFLLLFWSLLSVFLARCQ